MLKPLNCGSTQHDVYLVPVGGTCFFAQEGVDRPVMATDILRFKNVDVVREDRTIIHKIEFSLASGEHIALTGPSGAGKSTILHAAMGFVPPTSGTIYFDGIPMEPRTISQIRENVAFVFQEPVLGADIVEEALLLPFTFKRHRRIKPTRKQMTGILEQFGLNESILEQNTGALSGGEKQRIALARAILLRKSMFLIDEVTSALDAESANRVRNVLFQPEYTILSVAHDPTWLSNCTGVFHIARGTIQSIERKSKI